MAYSELIKNFKIGEIADRFDELRDKLSEMQQHMWGVATDSRSGNRIKHGGEVYYEPEYPNILFAKDGEIYDFDGKKAIAIGGAYSCDKEYRLLTGLPWFQDE